MNVLIIGGGGREHALAWKIKQSPLCSKLFLAPGNGGTSSLGVNIPVKPTDFEGIKKAVIENRIEFVVVGPDDPLGLGIVDYFGQQEELEHIPILGPPAAGAKLESSKDFAKAFMKRHDIPTASYRSFNKEEKEEAYSYVGNHGLPVVIKADGLAAGKGVAVCQTHEEAEAFLNEIWEENKFGASGDKVVVEAFLDGIELSVFILTDGQDYILLGTAKDYKRVGEGDTGPNTGGMGAVSPVPFADEEFMNRVKRKIITPTLKGLQEEGIPYRGFIFFGLMNVKGEPQVIEYNARMGDPETQALFPRIETDLLPFFATAAKGKLKSLNLVMDERFAVTVIGVSEGYPGEYKSGFKIEGLQAIKDAYVFHAGTRQANGHLVTSGGRVVAVTVKEWSLAEAKKRAYEELSKLKFDNLSFRKDIADDLIKSGRKHA